VKKSKAIFLGLAILFFLGLALIAWDFSGKTTFPVASPDSGPPVAVDSMVDNKTDPGDGANR
jgi:hypothetical protein